MKTDRMEYSEFSCVCVEQCGVSLLCGGIKNGFVCVKLGEKLHLPKAQLSRLKTG